MGGREASAEQAAASACAGAGTATLRLGSEAELPDAAAAQHSTEKVLAGVAGILHCLLHPLLPVIPFLLSSPSSPFSSPLFFCCNSSRLGEQHTPPYTRLRSGDMRLRSGRRLVSPPPPQGCRRRRHRPPEDRINSLPEDLLLQVLGCLETTTGVARVGAVCRRWRGLWTKLPDMTFVCVKPRLLEAVFAKFTRPRLHLLDIMVNAERTAEISSLLRAIAPLEPEKLRFVVVWALDDDGGDPVELPCFDRTSSLSLELMDFHLLPPPSGEFTKLKTLSLDSCRVDIAALLPLCPSLRVLELCGHIKVDTHTHTLIVHSPLLDKFSFESHTTDICCIDIVAPVLNEVKLKASLSLCGHVGFMGHARIQTRDTLLFM